MRAPCAWPVASFVLFLSVLLAGCAYENLAAPRLGLEAWTADSAEDDCLTFAARIGPGEECRAYGVHATSNEESRVLGLHAMRWSAATAEDVAYDAVASVGPVELAPGESAQLVVVVAVPQGAALAELQYRSGWVADPVRVLLPEA